MFKIEFDALISSLVRNRSALVQWYRIFLLRKTRFHVGVSGATVLLATNRCVGSQQNKTKANVCVGLHHPVKQDSEHYIRYL